MINSTKFYPLQFNAERSDKGCPSKLSHTEERIYKNKSPCSNTKSSSLMIHTTEFCSNDSSVRLLVAIAFIIGSHTRCTFYLQINLHHVPPNWSDSYHWDAIASTSTSRGRCYECLRCVAERYQGEKSKVALHIYKKHVALDAVPYYCSICRYIATYPERPW